jgi:hypothetical protein
MVYHYLGNIQIHRGQNLELQLISRMKSIFGNSLLGLGPHLSQKFNPTFILFLRWSLVTLRLRQNVVQHCVLVLTWIVMTGVTIILEFRFVSVLFGVVIVYFVILGTMQLRIKFFEVFRDNDRIFGHLLITNVCRWDSSFRNSFVSLRSRVSQSFQKSITWALSRSVLILQVVNRVCVKILSFLFLNGVRRTWSVFLSELFDVHF